MNPMTLFTSNPPDAQPIIDMMTILAYFIGTFTDVLMGKICGKCKQELDVSCFAKDRARADGLRWSCKACVRADFERFKATPSYGRRNENLKARWKKMREDDPFSNWCRVAFDGARARARKLNVAFDLDIEWIKQVAGNVCPLLGTPLSYTNAKQAADSPSIDRIRPELGYTKENCIVVSLRANRIKNDATLSEIKLLADNLAAYY